MCEPIWIATPRLASGEYDWPAIRLRKSAMQAIAQLKTKTTGDGLTEQELKGTEWLSPSGVRGMQKTWQRAY